MGSKNEPAWREAINHVLHFSFMLKAEIETRLGEEVGIGLADHEALINIHLCDCEPKMSDLADQLILSRGGVTKLVDRLEAAGLVRRTASPTDRRVTTLEITRKGVETVTRSRALIDELVLDKWAGKVTDEEARQITELIRRAYRDEQAELAD